MDKTTAQKFEMKEHTLLYDMDKSILLCKNSDASKNIWAKKISDISNLSDVIEDDANYYISCESGDSAGCFLAVYKNNGSSLWYIPGKPFLNLLFEGFLYLIFIDDKNAYYLLKVDRQSGNKIWHHRIDPDLTEYSFRSDRILLTYTSGRKEILSPKTGNIHISKAGTSHD
jgi:outer membrane protein assembly factor BamB